MPSPLVIGGIAFVVVVVVAVIIYFATQGGGGSPPSGGSPGPAPGPAPAPVPTDPRQSVWSSGQSIQGSSVVITAATPPTPANQPTGLTTGAAVNSYTISIDIKTSGKSAGWFRVYGSDPHPGYPGIWIKPTPEPGVIRIHFGPAAIDIPADKPVPFNSWVNIVVVYDSTAGTGTIYLNGTQVVTGTIPAFTWPSNLNMNFNVGKLADINVSVANTYWWNSVLTPSQIAQLAVPSAPTPGVATTSYYLPEPYDDAKETAGY